MFLFWFVREWLWLVLLHLRRCYLNAILRKNKRISCLLLSPNGQTSLCECGSFAAKQSESLKCSSLSSTWWWKWENSSKTSRRSPTRSFWFSSIPFNRSSSFDNISYSNYRLSNFIIPHEQFSSEDSEDILYLLLLYSGLLERLDTWRLLTCTLWWISWSSLLSRKILWLFFQDYFSGFVPFSLGKWSNRDRQHDPA